MWYKKEPSFSIRRKGDSHGMDAWFPGLEAEPKGTIIFRKDSSAFFTTNLSTEMQLMHVDTFVLYGVSTSGCVRTTVVYAMCHGFRPIVSSDFLPENRSHRIILHT